MKEIIIYNGLIFAERTKEAGINIRIYLVSLRENWKSRAGKTVITKW